jgi:hypothetical protein
MEGHTPEKETKWSPAGFEAPDPEIDGEKVVCAGCGDASPVGEMGVSADVITWESDDVVESVTRKYIHDDESCMLKAIGLDE